MQRVDFDLDTKEWEGTEAPDDGNPEVCLVYGMVIIIAAIAFALPACLGNPRLGAVCALGFLSVMFFAWSLMQTRGARVVLGGFAAGFAFMAVLVSGVV